MDKNKILSKDLIQYSILIYWLLFWLLNITDKIIGGAHFLFVGRDRFAQIERFFDSIGLPDPIYANIALIITAALQSFALIFFAGALLYFKKKNKESSRSWFLVGICFNLTMFTYFSLGDQVFGDHFELLEHGLFWFISLLSWLIFTKVDAIQLLNNYSIKKGQLRLSAILIVLISGITSGAIFYHNDTSFIERNQAVSAIKISENKFKFEFPFLAGSTAFENSLIKFKKEYTDLNIDYIYTAPKPMRLGKSDGLIVYIQTERKK